MTAPLFAGIGGHHSARSKTDEWLTPPHVHEAVGGAPSFDLDPASPVDRPWPTARAHYTEADNGLLLPWEGRVWLNPPYSNPLLSRFMGRMAAHGCGTALIFARTETDTFARFVWGEAAALLFLFGRLNFHHIDGTRAGSNSGAPSVLCAYGQGDAQVLADCGLPGQFVPLQLPRVFAVLAMSATWGATVRDYMRSHPGPVRLADIYRDLGSHPKARRNRNVEAKIRQELQRGAGRRVDRGLWEAA